MEITSPFIYNTVDAGVGNLRLIYRPHKMIGDVLETVRIADRELRLLCTNDSRCRVAVGEPLFENLRESDLLIGDISSVPIDYLVTKRPIVVVLRQPCDEPIVATNPFLTLCARCSVQQMGKLAVRLPTGTIEVFSKPAEFAEWLVLQIEEEPFRDRQMDAARHYLEYVDEPATPRFRQAVDRFFHLNLTGFSITFSECGPLKDRADMSSGGV